MKSWEAIYTVRENKRTDNWLHRCDLGPQRVVTSMMMVDLHGCPFCRGFPPDVTRGFDMWGEPTFLINGKPYPPRGVANFPGQRPKKAAIRPQPRMSE